MTWILRSYLFKCWYVTEIEWLKSVSTKSDSINYLAHKGLFEKKNNEAQYIHIKDIITCQILKKQGFFLNSDWDIWASRLIVWNYNMTVWILARNDINFSMTAGLIRLHMPASSNLVCNEGQRVSPYSPRQSLALFMENSTNYCCQKQRHNFHSSSQICCKYALLW